MKDLSLEMARLRDIDEIMLFMSQHWREGHVYSWSRPLLMKDFKCFADPERLNIGLARATDREILGVFCFMLYNQRDVPDLAGSMWKITEASQKAYPMLGIQLRDFVIKQVRHRFFATPGPGIQTQAIYKVLRLQWHQMKQFFLINPDLTHYQLIRHPESPVLPAPDIARQVELRRVESPEALEAFDFDAYDHILPFKDERYVSHRFFDYPFYEYDVYAVFRSNSEKAANLVVCRRAIAKTDDGKPISSAYRIVDYYGEEVLLPEIISCLYQKMRQQGDEFLDFICHGFDESLLKQSGMTSLDFEREDLVIPNFFEPLVKKNVPVYCIADRTTLRYRQCKADGDQDRPNGL